MYLKNGGSSKINGGFVQFITHTIHNEDDSLNFNNNVELEQYKHDSSYNKDSFKEDEIGLPNFSIQL